MKVATALYLLVAVVFSMLVMAAVSYFTSWVYIFPSIGPSVFTIFYFPSSPMSAPRNTVLGHACGLAIGYACYKLMGVVGFAKHSSLLLASSGISMGIFAIFMIITGIMHPPAASSCLIASLGLVKSLYQAVGMVGSMIFICLAGYVMNNLAGIEYPLWSPESEAPLPKIKTVLGDVSELESDDEIERLAAKIVLRQKLDDDE